MKRYLVKIIFFFVIVAVIDYGVGKVGDYLQGHAKGGSTKEFDDLVTKAEHDVLILGSSRAHHHYDSPYLSDTLGVDVFNAGYDGNGVILADGILELVLKHTAPKLVLFDVEPAFDIYVYAKDNEHKLYLSSLKPYYLFPEIERIIKDVSLEEWYKVHSGMIRYNSKLVSMIVDYAVPRNSLGSSGFSPLFGEISEDPNLPTSDPGQIDQLKLDYIERLIDLARIHSIPIVFIASPKFGSSDSSIMRPVKQICSDKQIPFLDYYSHPTFMSHMEWFNDPMHLNATGARAFSGMLVPMIESLLRD